MFKATATGTGATNDTAIGAGIGSGNGAGIDSAIGSGISTAIGSGIGSAVCEESAARKEPVLGEKPAVDKATG